MNMEGIYWMIPESPDKNRIETDLELLFGVRDIREITDPRLDTFIKQVLPKISSSFDRSEVDAI